MQCRVAQAGGEETQEGAAGLCRAAHLDVDHVGALLCRARDRAVFRLGAACPFLSVFACRARWEQSVQRVFSRTLHRLPPATGVTYRCFDTLF